MLSEIAVLCVIIAISYGEPTAPGIDRVVSEGVNSLGYRVVYGDEDLTIINEVVDDVEKRALKSKVRLNDAIEPLPAMDVKCLMSADNYCSKAMKETKSKNQQL